MNFGKIWITVALMCFVQITAHSRDTDYFVLQTTTLGKMTGLIYSGSYVYQPPHSYKWVNLDQHSIRYRGRILVYRHRLQQREPRSCDTGRRLTRERHRGFRSHVSRYGLEPPRSKKGRRLIRERHRGFRSHVSRYGLEPSRFRKLTFRSQDLYYYVVFYFGDAKVYHQHADEKTDTPKIKPWQQQRRKPSESKHPTEKKPKTERRTHRRCDACFQK